MMLLGFLGIYGATGTFDMEALRGVGLPTWATALVLVGILSKSATFPLHSWLPDAGIAPSPVSSLLHAAVLVKIGVYFYARLFVVTASIDPVFHVIVPVIAAVSALISAGCAMAATDLKRVVAYSTVSQLAFMLLGLVGAAAIMGRAIWLREALVVIVIGIALASWASWGLVLAGEEANLLRRLPVVTALLLLFLWLVLYKTKIGLAWRATAQDLEMAKAMGVNIRQVVALNFFLGYSFAAAAGIMVGMLYNSVYPTMGDVWEARWERWRLLWPSDWWKP